MNTLKFDTIIFDTAPTGHTLRFLNLPNILEKGLEQLVLLKEKFGGIIKNFSSMLDSDASQNIPNKVFDTMESLKESISDVNKQFKDENKTTFIAVCIPEFLSLYETERLIQELAKFKIDIHNIVINQVVFPDGDSACKMCTARAKMQKKYMDQIHELYDDFNIVKSPLQEDEVRGIKELRAFAHNLIIPYSPDE